MREFQVSVGGRVYNVRVPKEGDTLLVDGRDCKAALVRVHGNLYSLKLDSRSYDLHVRPDDGRFLVLVEGSEYEVWVEDKSRPRRPASVLRSKEHKAFEIKSPMPGLVSSLKVAPGARVSHGAPLLTLEAMKMENEIRSPRGGVVSEILVRSGQSVEKDDVLVRLRL